jgi:hypothetical protein
MFLYNQKALAEWGKVHQGGSVMFRPTMQEVLNIEQFCEKDFNKIKAKFFFDIQTSLRYCWKPLMSVIPWRWFYKF